MPTSTATDRAETPFAIAVSGLSKVFPGGRRALDEVSFTARRGEVLGLLGANGAGKTTAMRVLAGFLAPSAGQVQVAGYDVRSDSLRVRQAIGYLPEQVPLYRELRVREYLRYRAELKGVRKRAAAVDAVLESVDLRGEAETVIGQLSKGYRQRVGLADALLHQPEVLLLDEPTDGLDPNQRREVLALIGRLGGERAVLLSTHVLPEVESLCQRVVILDRGRVAASGSLAELLERLRAPGRVEVSCRGEQAALRAALAAVPGVAEVQDAATTDDVHGFVVVLQTPELGMALEALARAVLSVGELRELSPARSSLDAVFRWLTSAHAAPPQEPPP